MEDAMILNKAAVERGLAHASIYKTEVNSDHKRARQWAFQHWKSTFSLFILQLIDLAKISAEQGKPILRFGEYGGGVQGLAGLAKEEPHLKHCDWGWGSQAFYSGPVLCAGSLPSSGAGKRKESGLDADGFPSIGTFLSEGDPFYWQVPSHAQDILSKNTC